MKRRTRIAGERAAAKRARKPSGQSRYALKEARQRQGKFSPRSPIHVLAVTPESVDAELASFDDDWATE